MKIKALYSVFFIVLGLIIVISDLLAGQPAVWIEGSVTKTPWIVDSRHMIEVNGGAYCLLPDIRISHRYLRNKGAYDERNVKVNSIIKGQKIMIKVRKKDVVQIILF